jgi:hypothetical protein
MILVLQVPQNYHLVPVLDVRIVATSYTLWVIAYRREYFGEARVGL